MNKKELHNIVKESFEYWKEVMEKQYPIEFDNLGGVVHVFITPDHPEFIKSELKWNFDNDLGSVDTTKRNYRKHN